MLSLYCIVMYYIVSFCMLMPVYCNVPFFPASLLLIVYCTISVCLCMLLVVTLYYFGLFLDIYCWLFTVLCQDYYVHFIILFYFGYLHYYYFAQLSINSTTNRLYILHGRSYRNSQVKTSIRYANVWSFELKWTCRFFSLLYFYVWCWIYTYHVSCSFLSCEVWCLHGKCKWSSWSWSYGCWIYNYLCNQCISPLTLWFRIPLMARCTTLCDKVRQWFPAGWWFSQCTAVSSANKTDHRDISEIFFKVLLFGDDTLTEI
jgi:hypothetical protein